MVYGNDVASVVCSQDRYGVWQVDVLLFDILFIVRMRTPKLQSQDAELPDTSRLTCKGFENQARESSGHSETIGGQVVAFRSSPNGHLKIIDVTLKLIQSLPSLRML